MKRLRPISFSRIILYLICSVPAFLILLKINEDCSSVDNSTWWSVFHFNWISNDVVIAQIVFYKLIVLIGISFALTIMFYKIIRKLFVAEK